MYSKGLEGNRREIRESLLFDHLFSFEYGKAKTGREFGINLNYSNRALFLEAMDDFGFFDVVAWLLEAKKMISQNNRLFIKNIFT